MAVRRLDAGSFAQIVEGGDVPVVVDFYADWCGPCHHLAPVMESLSERHYGRILFAKVNVDDEPELAARYAIRSIPAVILFEGGAPKARSIGAKPAPALERDLGLKHVHGGGDGAAAAEPAGRVRAWWRRR